MQGRQIVADEPAQQTEQVADFACRPRPILGAEREDRQIEDAELMGGANHATQRFDAAAMTFRPRQAARCRPPAVAVHDDRYVSRYQLGGDRRRCTEGLVGHAHTLTSRGRRGPQRHRLDTQSNAITPKRDNSDYLPANWDVLANKSKQDVSKCTNCVVINLGSRHDRKAT